MPILGIIASQISGHLVAPTSPVAGYNVWLDAADTGTITVSGTAVTQWTDKSANAYAFAQGTSAQRPASGTETQNGKNVMVYANSNLLSTAASSVWKYLSDGSLYTVMIACKTSTTNAEQYLLSNYSGSGGSIGISFGSEATNRLEYIVFRNVSGAVAVGNSTDNNTLGTSFTYVSALMDPSNGTAANRSDIRLKQGAAVKNNTTTNAVNTANPFSALRIGDYTTGSNTSAWYGQIGEILIYPSLLSSGNLLLNQQYLAAKWGV